MNSSARKTVYFWFCQFIIVQGLIQVHNIRSISLKYQTCNKIRRSVSCNNEKIDQEQEQNDERTYFDQVEILPPNKMDSKRSMARAKALPLSRLKAALDRRGVKYSRNASRVQLECLFANVLERGLPIISQFQNMPSSSVETQKTTPRKSSVIKDMINSNAATFVKDSKNRINSNVRENIKYNNFDVTSWKNTPDNSRIRTMIRRRPRSSSQIHVQNVSQKLKHKSSPRYTHHRQRYWKDKAEEHFDYMFGIHKDGVHYKRWEEQLKSKKNPSNDLVSSYFTKNSKRNTKGDIPFWEDKGNSLSSLLFGKNLEKHKKRLPLIEFLRNFHEKEKNQIVASFFVSTFKTIFILLGYACRWTSVHGSLPQPIIVFSMITSILCAPRRHKILTVLLTFLFCRALAEALHGYKNGNEGWEENEIV